MPLQVIEAIDPLTHLVRLETSPIYELVLSLRTLLLPARRSSAWAARAREALEPAFWNELAAVYGRYADGGLFFELPIDYPDHEDVEGFFDYVRDMDPVRFVFYLTGRVVPVERLVETRLEPRALDEALNEVRNLCHWLCQAGLTLEPILADVPAFQERLVNLWRWYWEGFFRDEVEALRPHWQASLRHKAAILSRTGGQALLEYVTGKTELPAPLPPDYPVTEVLFVPIVMAPSPVYMFYGYSNVTIVFDSQRTEARRAEIERGKEQTLAICKALADSSRLDVLRLITRHEGELHGKQIAAKLDLAASSVSRHLAQLRDAGLIAEEVHDDRTITYRLQENTVERLPEMLLDYLWHG
ncbi:MAG TPA: metalloregulator ArsR/SmtB family transcription factor [Aggregatilineaceae bacterium]|jgi:DNA-binding transcriptional ArsR family regulator|nr:metalloregulator ArsR/SmtB family transcription factor [Anaerolineae bacterium]HMM29143.1 metalloregulator ArsR/SmtB family transcription factor [Aggregatilineaceae bacterium]